MEAKRGTRSELHGNGKACGKDKIKLNVGGVLLAPSRSTLTAFPNSKLAMLFSGRWDKKLQRDKNNRVFLDVDPACFRVILDYLTLCSKSPGVCHPLPLSQVSEDLKTVFAHLCNIFNIIPQMDESHVASTVTAADGEDDDDEGDIVSADDCENAGDDGHIITAADDEDGDESDIEVSCNSLRAALKEEHSLLDSIEHALLEDERLFLDEEQLVDSFAAGETKESWSLM